MICLIAELSYVTRLTDDIRNNFQAMKEINIYTRLSPSQRLLKLRAFIDRINSNERIKKILSEWGLELCSDTVRITARNIGNETFIFGKKENGNHEMLEITTTKWDKSVSSVIFIN